MARERNCVICRINSTSYCVLHFIYTPYMQLASYIWFSLGDNNDFLTFAAIFVKNLSNKDSISEKKKKTKRKRERERVRRRMKGIYYVKTRENDEIKAIFFFFFLIVKARREVDEIKYQDTKCIHTQNFVGNVSNFNCILVSYKRCRRACVLNKTLATILYLTLLNKARRV